MGLSALVEPIGAVLPGSSGAGSMVVGSVVVV
jgi:hypothetical protein